MVVGMQRKSGLRTALTSVSTVPALLALPLPAQRQPLRIAEHQRRVLCGKLRRQPVRLPAAGGGPHRGGPAQSSLPIPTLSSYDARFSWSAGMS